VIAGIADIARDRKTKSSPLMNTDDTDQKIGDRKGKTISHKGREETQRTMAIRANPR
jgi:hypothetical protein